MKIDVEFDKDSRFFKNCKQQRKREAKICNSCPFRIYIEQWERES